MTRSSSEKCQSARGGRLGLWQRLRFREALRQHDLSYVLAVEPTTKALTRDPNLVALPPAKPTGRPRQYAAPESLPQAKTLLEIARELPASAWKTLTWREEGTKGPMRSRFALVAVWASHGANRSQRHFERVREWLLVEWPKEEDAPTKYWLGYFGEGEEHTLKEMVKLAHIRWRVELDYREMKDELGLDHFEGRHWLGFHHHVILVSIAYAFLRSEQLRSKKAAALTLPTIRRNLQALLIRMTGRCPWCHTRFNNSS